MGPVSLQTIWHKTLAASDMADDTFYLFIDSHPHQSLVRQLPDWFNRLVAGLSETQQQVIWQLRLPRTLLAIAVGGGLALCGAVLQILLHNPVAGARPDWYIQRCKFTGGLAYICRTSVGNHDSPPGVSVSLGVCGGINRYIIATSIVTAWSNGWKSVIAAWCRYWHCQ